MPDSGTAPLQGYFSAVASIKNFDGGMLSAVGLGSNRRTRDRAVHLSLATVLTLELLKGCPADLSASTHQAMHGFPLLAALVKEARQITERTNEELLPPPRCLRLPRTRGAMISPGSSWSCMRTQSSGLAWAASVTRTSEPGHEYRRDHRKVALTCCSTLKPRRLRPATLVGIVIVLDLAWPPVVGELSLQGTSRLSGWLPHCSRSLPRLSFSCPVHPTCIRRSSSSKSYSGRGCRESGSPQSAILV